MRHRIQNWGTWAGLALATATAPLPLSAQAIEFTPPRCGWSVGSDSYGLGLEWGVLDRGDATPMPVNADCFELGRARGSQLRAEGCSEREFRDGHRRGWQVDPGSSAGTACYAAGYASGVAWLDFGARLRNEAWATWECILRYGDGVADHQNDRPSQTPSDWNATEVHCYQLGYWEG